MAQLTLSWCRNYSDRFDVRIGTEQTDPEGWIVVKAQGSEEVGIKVPWSTNGKGYLEIQWQLKGKEWTHTSERRFFIDHEVFGYDYLYAGDSLKDRNLGTGKWKLGVQGALPGQAAGLLLFDYRSNNVDGLTALWVWENRTPEILSARGDFVSMYLNS